MMLLCQQHTIATLVYKQPPEAAHSVQVAVLAGEGRKMAK